MRILPIVAALLALAACQQKAQQQPANESATAEQGDQIKGVHRDNAGKGAPAAAFTDPAGKPVKLADFKGKPLLVNLWATW